jgi:hypothetical protein
MIYPIVKPIVTPIVRNIVNPEVLSIDNLISPLFAAGEQGVWFDPSDFSTMFQDRAGTTPVTGAGQPVGKILDKSGRGNHALAPADTTVRPTLQQDASGNWYLSCDGVDDSMATASFAAGADSVTVGAAMYKLSDAAFAVFAEFSALLSANNGAWALTAPVSASSSIGFNSKGTVTASASRTSVAAPAGFVVIGFADISTPIVENRVNDLAAVTTVTSQGSGNYGSYPLYLFRRGGTVSAFTGRAYGLVVRYATSTAAEIANLKAYMKIKGGI